MIIAFRFPTCVLRHYLCVRIKQKFPPILKHVKKMLRRNETLDNFLRTLEKDEQLTFLKNIYFQCFDVMNGDRQKTEQMLGQISTPVLVQIDLKNVHKALSKNTGEKKESIIFVQKQMEKIFGSDINDIKESTKIMLVDDNNYSTGNDTDVTDVEDNKPINNSSKKIYSNQTIPSSPVSEHNNESSKIIQTDQLNISPTHCSTLKENNYSNVGSVDGLLCQIVRSYSLPEDSQQNLIQAIEVTAGKSNIKNKPFCQLVSESYSIKTNVAELINTKLYTPKKKKLFKKIKKFKKKERERKISCISNSNIVAKKSSVEETQTEIKREIPMFTTPLSLSTFEDSTLIDLTISDEDVDNDRPPLIINTESVVDNIPAKSVCSVITSCFKSIDCNDDSNEVNINESLVNDQECQSQPPSLISASLLGSCSSLINTTASSVKQYPNTIFTEPSVSSRCSSIPIAAETQTQTVLIKEMLKDKTKVITEKIKRWVYEYFKYYGKNTLIDRLENRLKKGNLLINLDEYWNSSDTVEITDCIIRLIWSLSGKHCNIVPLMGCFMTLFRRTVVTTELSDVDTYKKFLAFSDVVKRCVLSWNKQFWKTWMFPDSFMYGCYIVDHVLYGGTSRVKSMHHLVNWAKISCIKKYFRMPSYRIPLPEFILSHRETSKLAIRKTRLEPEIVNKEVPSPKIPKINVTSTQNRPPLAVTPAINVRPQFNIRNFLPVDRSLKSYQPNPPTLFKQLTSPPISLHTSPFISSQHQANNMMPTATSVLSNPNMRQYIPRFNSYLTHHNIHISVPTHQTDQTQAQQTPTRLFSYNNYYRTNDPCQNIHMPYNSQTTSSPGLPDASSPNMPDQPSTYCTSSASQNYSNLKIIHPNDCLQYNITNLSVSHLYNKKKSEALMALFKDRSTMLTRCLNNVLVFDEQNIIKIILLLYSIL
ncbi:uncharacterized protein LOC126901149 isoform X3 [Daktulosphaira vitifoliae]|nr:uncharacterized protein LOC126901149 isoform X3 [Daktulosphaira vitifoliae]